MLNALTSKLSTLSLQVVLTDDLSCAKDDERVKLAFFKCFNSIYHKFSFVDKNVLLHLSRLHAMSFYGAETWYIILNKKDLKSISVPYHKAIKRMCGKKLI